MYGFQLIRGDLLVYNLTGATRGHPFHDPAPPKWAESIDGLTVEEVLKKIKASDPAKADLIQACEAELARYGRSRSKLGGEHCAVKLVVEPEKPR